MLLAIAIVRDRATEASVMPWVIASQTIPILAIAPMVIVVLNSVGVTGIVLTKMDGDARGGAALSIYGITKKPIKFIGVGEKLDALEDFHPDRMAGRILQQGDVLTLVEKAQAAFDEDEAKRLEKKVRKEGMDLEDFLVAMKQMQKLGPLENLLKLLPGVNASMLKQAKIDPKRMKHVEAIVLSMTKAERKKPDLLNASRRKRIAAGAGVEVQDINRLLKQHRQMADMVKSLSKGGGKNLQKMAAMMGGMPGMPGGGMGGMGGGPDMNRLKSLGGGRMPEPTEQEMKALQDRLSGLGGGQMPGGLPGLPGLPTKKPN